jgi:hypothetical protein
MKNFDVVSETLRISRKFNAELRDEAKNFKLLGKLLKI